MRIILVRHGQSKANEAKIKQSKAGDWSDTSLSDKGKEQARKVAERLKDEKIDIIYVSNLKRCIETAEEINKFHNVKINIDKRLRDRLESDDKEAYIKRIEEFLRDVEKENKNCLIVGHGVSCLTFLALTTGSKEEGGKLHREHCMNFKNSCVSLVEKENGKFKIRFIGCTKHLE